MTLTDVARAMQMGDDEVLQMMLAAAGGDDSWDEDLYGEAGRILSRAARRLRMSRLLTMTFVGGTSDDEFPLVLAKLGDTATIVLDSRAAAGQVTIYGDLKCARWPVTAALEWKALEAFVAVYDGMLPGRLEVSPVLGSDLDRLKQTLSKLALSVHDFEEQWSSIEISVEPPPRRRRV